MNDYTHPYPILSDTASVSTAFWHRCSIAQTEVRGNQHVRSEHGRCVVCGKRFTRKISWKTRTVQVFATEGES